MQTLAAQLGSAMANRRNGFARSERSGSRRVPAAVDKHATLNEPQEFCVTALAMESQPDGIDTVRG